MTTTQIVIVLIIVIILVGILISYHMDLDHKRMKDNRILFAIMMVGMLLVITITSTTEINRLRKELKCPEYERVDNLYKLKQ